MKEAAKEGSRAAPQKPRQGSALLLRRTAACDVLVTARGAGILLECVRTRGRNGFVKEDLFYAVLLRPEMVLEGPDGLQLRDREGRRIALADPCVLCGGKSLIVRGEAAGGQIPEILVAARDLARAAQGGDDGAGRPFPDSPAELARS